ncbi:hypothetical protein CTAYLR_004444 [Chrysophaeum taylorii]|uniref:Serine hydrolase domain-containing protein n=1 Tax=Chrysophaeum taylorii TaxID=2483200 RepID=A0AAD7XJQ8_9STRA|nr:hypothetical protein CTAYLR_004444 [Chrysophaeum taylorii]
MRMFFVVAALKGSLAMSTVRRILVLHGKGGSGPSMRDRFARITSALPEFDFVFPTAPHESSGGFAWWLVKPGERSFTATEFIGLEDSLNLIRREQKQTRFEAVWGHSQGAILLAAVLARAQRYRGNFGLSPPVFAHSRLVKYILNGAAWPAPFEDDLRDLTEVNERTLHCYGTADDINPPDQAARLAALFDGTTYVHSGGHYVPDDADAILAYRNFLVGGRGAVDR